MYASSPSQPTRAVLRVNKNDKTEIYILRVSNPASDHCVVFAL